MTFTRHTGLVLTILFSNYLSLYGQGKVGGNDSGADADKPILVWHFQGGDEPGITHEIRKQFVAGPRPPMYPGFPADNTAYAVVGAKSALVIREADVPKQKLRFQQGDSITLEAWVQVQELKENAYAYLLGKGRNGKPQFSEKNQNYALRVKGEKGEARLTFLFGSEATKDKPADWHRWTSTRGFSLGGWHHVAVTYTFGKPNSIRGYIDGQPVTGTWDMGGATERPPAHDADDLVIGTGNGGGAGNSLTGKIDEVAIWRSALTETTIANRYQFVPPPPVVKKEQLPPDAVVVHLVEEGLPARNAWPDQPLPPTEIYREDTFGFFDIPRKYVDTGVRADRSNPLLLRAAARVKFPVGKHRFLLRARGASRLYIDEKLILSTPFPPQDGSGHGKVRAPDSYLDLGPDFRFAPPGNRENWVAFESTGAEHLIVMETLVGGYVGNNKRRPELGETVVAVSFAGLQSWQLVSPGKRVVPYTDEGWGAYEAERTAHYDRVNAKARADLRETQKAYWDQRRETAKQWLANTPDVKVPPLVKGAPAHNAIDHFIAAQWQAVRGAQLPNQTVDYFKQVHPILEARCFSCHSGGKPKGDLRLDDRAAMLQGGKSDGSAVIPGKPNQSALLKRVRTHQESEVMPPKGERLTREEIQTLETWIREGATRPELNDDRTIFSDLTDDLAFLRRVTLDTVGVVPTLEEIRAYQADKPTERRAKAIDRLLQDPRWADHWMGYWQDVLAENPNILNPTLNNTGPFRWWIYESLSDNKPMDLFVTELLRMKGSERFGGPAGFGIASQNDVPAAAKGTIVASAFLGIEMKCARCHDAPAHRSTQQELFHLGAMLAAKPLTVPTTSSVPMDRFHQGDRKPLITVTLKPGTTVEPKWPFASLVAEPVGKELAQFSNDPRDRLAALITAPQNTRFAEVMANRIWKRWMGRGLVEPIDDWERAKPSHPELLKWLAREFVRGGYDVKRLSKVILQSHAYQRAVDHGLRETGPLFATLAPRRLTAEQIVDSLFVATGKPFRLEEVSLDIDGMRDLGNSISLGKPRRSWMLTSTSNERDRPSLALPRIQAVVDVLQAYGWRGARQDPTSARDQSPNVLQPAILSNGTVGVWVTRLSDDHGITELAIQSTSVDGLLDDLFLRILTRKPTDAERRQYAGYLAPGFAERVRPAPPTGGRIRKPIPYVSWSNHLDPEATIVRQREEAAARQGDPCTERLNPQWRARMEDVLWALVNSSEWIFSP